MWFYTILVSVCLFVFVWDTNIYTFICLNIRRTTVFSLYKREILGIEVVLGIFHYLYKYESFMPILKNYLNGSHRPVVLVPLGVLWGRGLKKKKLTNFLFPLSKFPFWKLDNIKSRKRTSGWNLILKTRRKRTHEKDIQKHQYVISFRRNILALTLPMAFFVRN